MSRNISGIETNDETLAKEKPFDWSWLWFWLAGVGVGTFVERARHKR